MDPSPSPMCHLVTLSRTLLPPLECHALFEWPQTSTKFFSIKWLRHCYYRKKFIKKCFKLWWFLIAQNQGFPTWGATTLISSWKISRGNQDFTCLRNNIHSVHQGYIFCLGYASRKRLETPGSKNGKVQVIDMDESEGRNDFYDWKIQTKKKKNLVSDRFQDLVCCVKMYIK
jgi:hypothetical protein